MDKSVLVAIVALCGTLITVAGGVVIAILTSNKESRSSAESALEKALRERLVLRDEQLQDIAEDRNRERDRADRYKKELDQLRLAALESERRTKNV